MNLKELEAKYTELGAFGVECRKFWQQGTGAARDARRFTRLKVNRAMRAQGKLEVHQGIQECSDN